MTTFLGLRTLIHPVSDLAAMKAWYTEVVGHGPYFDEPFYVGFEVAGYELGLLPGASERGPLTYWGVGDADAALAELVAAGATVVDEVRDVGDGIRTAGVADPEGTYLGIIENPHFRLADPPVGSSAGPGR